MGRHHTDDDVTAATPLVAMRSTPFVVIPAPRVSPEGTTPVSAPAARGWRARRNAKAEAATAQAHAVQLAHAQRRARQVALASGWPAAL